MTHQVREVHQEFVDAGKAKRRYKRIARFAIPTAGLVAVGASAADAWINDAGVGSAEPLLGFILPIVIPLVALIAKAGADRMRCKAEGALCVNHPV